jgi:hypothetical protein
MSEMPLELLFRYVAYFALFAALLSIIDTILSWVRRK